jgi:hypothetical protein
MPPLAPSLARLHYAAKLGDPIQGLRQIFQQFIGRLDSNRHAHQTIADA